MTVEEHKRFLEQGFDDVSIDKLVDISKITEYAEVMKLTADEEIHRLFLG